MHDRPIILYPDVAERIDKRLELWRKVSEGNRFSRYRLSLLLTGEVRVENDEAHIVVRDFFAMPAWSSSTIELDMSLADIEKIAQEYMVVGTLVACPKSRPLDTLDIGLLLSVDAAVGRPVPHIVVSSGGNRTIISFEKCKGIAELLKSLRANLERNEEIA